MSKVIDKATLQQKQEVCTKLNEAFDSLQEEVEAFNNIMLERWTKVSVAIDVYNAAISDANEWQSVVASEIQDFIGDKSEKWQEGEKGQAYASWKEQYEEELETVELEKPDEVVFDNDNPSELLDQKPDEAEG